MFQLEDIERGDRLKEPLQLQFSDRFELREVFDRSANFLRDQNLPGLGFTAQACGKVGHRSDRTIVPSSLESDRADGRETLRDAGAETELETAFAPPADLKSVAS